MQVVVIHSFDEFDNYYHQLKESATQNEENCRYVIGLDVEYVSDQSAPKLFKDDKCPPWVLVAPKKQAVCTIQLATDSICMVIHLVKTGNNLSSLLKKILTGQSWIKVGVGIENDMQLLSDNYNLGHCKGVIELLNLALLAEIPNPSLENLYRHFIDLRYENTVNHTESNWVSDLTSDEIIYAAKDAIASYEVGIEFIGQTINSINYTHQRIAKYVSINNLEIVSSTEDISITDNPVGRLQEIMQSKNSPLPVYSTMSKISSRSRKIKIRCTCGDASTTGMSISKATAKSISASKMLELLETLDKDESDKESVEYTESSDDDLDNYIGMINEHHQKNSSIEEAIYEYQYDTRAQIFRVICRYNDKISQGHGRNKILAKKDAAQRLWSMLSETTKS